jgi:Cu/Ag efflux protein CusF
MNKVLTPVIAAFALMAATLAYAADVTNSITKIDAATHSVTLGDNKVYVFSATTDLSKMKVGDKVKITFTTDAAGKNNATAIAPAA